jgi:hypothetical protein
MAIQLEKFFIEVFAPQNGDVLTIMYDQPHGEIRDNTAWQERRDMAEEWFRKTNAFAQDYGVRVNPVVVYESTGGHARDLPEYAQSEGRTVRLED